KSASRTQTGFAASGAALGELNTTQLESWQRRIELVAEDGRRHQMRLFTDRDKEELAAEAPGDVAEVVLSSLVVRRRRQFGAAAFAWNASPNPVAAGLATCGDFPRMILYALHHEI